MKNPFKGSGQTLTHLNIEDQDPSNKLVIVAGIITFVVIIVVMFESVVAVEAGHRGVVLYVGAVENRVLGEGIHFIIPFAEQVIHSKYVLLSLKRMQLPLLTTCKRYRLQ